MLIPAVFYGRYTAVKARMNALAEKIMTGKSFMEALGQQRLVETSVMTSVYINLLTHRDISIAQSHFHMTLLAAALQEASGSTESKESERVFYELLEKDWGLLILADAGDGWFLNSLISDNSARNRPYLQAVLKYNSRFENEGKHFIGKDGRLGTFWQANSALQIIFQEEGVTASSLKEQGKAASFKALCRGLRI